MIEYMNLICSQTCSRPGASDFSPTTVSMEDSQYADKIDSWEYEYLIILLKWLLDKNVKLAMVEQITTMENIFTLKMKTFLTQRVISGTNTITADLDWTQNGL